MTSETVKKCIKDLNKNEFFKKNIQTDVLKHLDLAMCFKSIIQYEKTFYKTQGEYTRNCCNVINPKLALIIENIVLRNKYFKIDCWDINPSKSSKYVVVFNGIGNEKSNYNLQNTYLKLVENGWGVVAFDYRGRGKSGGFFCQKNALEDALLINNYLLKKGIKQENVGVLGHSMGAAVALDFASKINLDFVVLINPFNKAADMVKILSQQLKMPSIIKETIQKLPDFLIPIKNRFNNERNLTKVAAPTLILHSKKDKTVPIDLCRQLYEKSQLASNITYLELEGDDHEINDEKIELSLQFMKESHLWFFHNKESIFAQLNQ